MLPLKPPLVFGSSTVGSSTVGSSTVGSSTVGSSTVGSSTAGSSTAGSSTAGSGDADRRERRGLRDRDLAALAQLEQCEERNGLLDARQTRDLGVEVETLAPSEGRRGNARGTAKRAGSGAPCARADTFGGSTANPLSASTSRIGSCGASLRSNVGASGAGPRRKKRSRSAVEPVARARPRPPSCGGTRRVGAQAPRRPPPGRARPARPPPRGRDARAFNSSRAAIEHEELSAGLEIELVSLGQTLDEGDHDRRHVDLGRVRVILEEERQQKVERALERVEVQLELVRTASVGRGPTLRRQVGRALRGTAIAGRLTGRACGGTRSRRRGRAEPAPPRLCAEDDQRRRRRTRASETQALTAGRGRVGRVDPQQLDPEAPEAVERDVERRTVPAGVAEATLEDADSNAGDRRGSREARRGTPGGRSSASK